MSSVLRNAPISSAPTASAPISRICPRQLSGVRPFALWALASAMAVLAVGCIDIQYESCYFPCRADHTECGGGLECNLELGYCVEPGYYGVCGAEVHEVSVCEGEPVEISLVNGHQSQAEEFYGGREVPEAEISDGVLTHTFERNASFGVGAAGKRQLWRVSADGQCLPEQFRVSACEGQSIDTTLTTGDQEGGLQWELLDASDSGFTLSSDGQLKGSVAATDVVPLDVRITDAAGVSVRRTVTIVPQAFTPPVPEFSETCSGLQRWNLDDAFEWSWAEEPVDGFSLRKDGYLESSNATGVGDYQLKVNAEDECGVHPVEFSINLVQCPEPVPRTIDLPRACEGGPYRWPIPAISAGTDLTWHLRLLDIDGVSLEPSEAKAKAQQLELQLKPVDTREAELSAPKELLPVGTLGLGVQIEDRSTQRQGAEWLTDLVVQQCKTVKQTIRASAGARFEEALGQAGETWVATVPTWMSVGKGGLVTIQSDEPKTASVKAWVTNDLDQPYVVEIDVVVEQGLAKDGGVGLDADASDVGSETVPTAESDADAGLGESGALEATAPQVPTEDAAAPKLERFPDGCVGHFYRELLPEGTVVGDLGIPGLSIVKDVGQVMLQGTPEAEFDGAFRLTTALTSGIHTQDFALLIRSDCDYAFRAYVPNSSSYHLYVGNATATDSPIDVSLDAVGSETDVVKFAFSPNARSLAFVTRPAGATRDTLHLVGVEDLPHLAPVHFNAVPLSGLVTGLAWSPSGAKLLVLSDAPASELQAFAVNASGLSADLAVELPDASGAAWFTERFACALSARGAVTPTQKSVACVDLEDAAGHQIGYGQAVDAAAFSGVEGRVSDDGIVVLLSGGYESRFWNPADGRQYSDLSRYLAPTGSWVASSRPDWLEVAHPFDPTMFWEADDPPAYEPLARIDDCDSVSAWSNSGRTLACPTSTGITLPQLAEDGSLAARTLVVDAGHHEVTNRRAFTGAEGHYVFEVGEGVSAVQVGAGPSVTVQQIGLPGSGIQKAIEPVRGERVLVQGRALWLVSFTSDGLANVSLLSGDTSVQLPALCERDFFWNGFSGWCGGDLAPRRFSPSADSASVLFLSEDDELWLSDLRDPAPRRVGAQVVCTDSVTCASDFLFAGDRRTHAF